ncbi:hypothetical protein ACN47E_007838 [Coniothyrium glycines]
MASTQSLFLDKIPPELRLLIYSNLLVTPTPLKGQLARGTTTYNLETSILRTNSQVYNEARPVFFGKNFFYITSCPSTTSTEDDVGVGAFEPPLQLKDLPLIRHLQIDLLFYPKVLRMLSGPRYGGWTPVCPAAERYVRSLTYLLDGVKESLLSLQLCADTRRCVSNGSISNGSSQDMDHRSEEEDEDLDVKKVLTGFHMVDRNRRFKELLAMLSVRSISLRFDFAESNFEFKISRDMLCRTNMASLAGQILIAKNDIEMKAVLQELGDGDHGPVWEEGSVDLWPATMTRWPLHKTVAHARRAIRAV